MCSTCDCDKSPIEDVTEQSEDNKRQCRKCSSNSYILLNKVHAECKACFLESCHKKFRSTIGRSKLVKNNESIVIAYSGGPSSTALMSLIKNSIANKFQREQKFKPSVFHVDTSLLLDNFDQDIGEVEGNAASQARFSELHQFLLETTHSYPGWPIYWTTIEAFYGYHSKSHVSSSPFYAQYDEHSFSPSHPLLNCLTSLKDLKSHMHTMDLTDQQQFVKTMIESLVSKAVSHINHSMQLADNPEERPSFVFTGSSSTRLANNLLVDVILGLGSSIGSTVAVCDQKDGVSVLRPMRDFTKKEIVYYLRALKLEPRVKLNLATLTGTQDSIQRLSEVFLCRLYTDYPSTYSTLLRTGNKMLH